MIIKFLIALSGPALLGLYIEYDYGTYGTGTLEHLLNPSDGHQLIFHLGMFLLPVLTLYSAYLIHQREALLENIEAHKSELQTLSLTDELTGLYNRRGLTALLEQELRRAHRMKKGLSVLYMDLDNLKDINDSLGHKVGDQALVDTASMIREVFRESDIVARIGGDEYVVVPVDVDEEVGEMIRRLKQVFKEREKSDGRPYSVSVSMGTAHYNPHTPSTVEELINEADKAMYEMKKAKRKEKH
jgi:diguanylate cyclase (GGDEF)-like protein